MAQITLTEQVITAPGGTTSSPLRPQQVSGTPLSQVLQVLGQQLQSGQFLTVLMLHLSTTQEYVP